MELPEVITLSWVEEAGRTQLFCLRSFTKLNRHVRFAPESGHCGAARHVR